MAYQAVNFPEELAIYDSNLSVLLNTFPYSVDDESRDTVGSDTFLQADLLDLAQTPDIGELELQPSPKVRRQAPSSLPNTTEEITDRNATRVTRPEDVALPSIERTTQPQRLEDIVNLPEQVVAQTSTTAQSGNIPSAQAANALYAPQLKPPINRVLARAAASDSETLKTTATPNEI
ncbi:hypothetical protein B0A48_11681 [Cryoendolithus antarcticus]|uniref:Uncharacterized protein n=1 Tax=Cryoendolithus antarcticus TaxID=1507870 RepID=A0A1V8SSU3_9PEZI|nr:hypothetical protein B0A48_11681 [Cryoendolithus antarcticus]